MLYLLTLGWPWFLSAAALGLIVGVATKPPKAGFKANIGFALLGATTLLLLAAALLSEKFQGREALTLEFALLAGTAYFLGVLGGGMFKTGASVPAAGRPKSRHEPTPVLRFQDGGKVRVSEPTSAPSPQVAPGPVETLTSVSPEPSGERLCRASGQRLWPLPAPAARTISRRSRGSDPRTRPS